MKTPRGPRGSHACSTTASPRNYPGTLSTNTTAKPTEKAFNNKMPCLYCNNSSHSLDRCAKLEGIQFHQRIDFLCKHGLCFRCLRKGHVSHLCRSKSTCQKCQRRHPTVLHIEKRTNYQEGKTDEDTLSHNLAVGQIECHTGATDIDCTMAVIPVTIRAKNGIKSLRTYAFMDPGSNVSFCSET